jgi:hypothetical protein
MELNEVILPFKRIFMIKKFRGTWYLGSTIEEIRIHRLMMKDLKNRDREFNRRIKNNLCPCCGRLR